MESPNSRPVLENYTEVFAEIIAKKLWSKMEPKIREVCKQMLEHETGGIKDDDLYSTEFLAKRWFPEKTLRNGKNSIYRIPEIDLPRHRIGTHGGRVLFYGKEIREYESTGRKRVLKSFGDK